MPNRSDKSYFLCSILSEPLTAASAIVFPVVQRTGIGEEVTHDLYLILEITNSYCIHVLVYVRQFLHVFQAGFDLSILLSLYPSSVTDTLMG